MTHDVILAVVAGLGAMFAWGLADFVAKLGIDRLGDQTTLFWSQFAGFLGLAAMFAIHPEVPKLRPNDLLFLVLLGMLSALSYLFLYSAFGKGQVSLLGPVSSSFGVGAVVLAALLFHETISAGRAAAAAGVLVGIVLIGANTSDIGALLRRETGTIDGMREALLAMTACSFFFVLFEHLLGNREWLFFLMVVRGSAALTVAVQAHFARPPLVVVQTPVGTFKVVANADDSGHPLAVPRKHRDLWPALVVIGLCDVAAFVFVSYGFANSTQFSIVSVLSSTFSLVTIVLARVFLKERMSRVQVAGALTILGCIALVSAT